MCVDYFWKLNGIKLRVFNFRGLEIERTSLPLTHSKKKDEICVRVYSRRGKYSHNFQKTAGTKTEISPLRYMIEILCFFRCTHICHSNIIKRGSLDIFNRFVDMQVQFDPKNWSTWFYTKLPAKFLEMFFNIHWTSKNQILYFFLPIKIKKSKPGQN
jgi:hypothetical protein